MNQIDFWFNGPPKHHILLYNVQNKLDENDLVLSVEKTFPDILLLYNIYSDKGDENKLKIIDKIKFKHHFYTKYLEDNTIDSGIMILSNFPIIIYSNTPHIKTKKRIARVITFTIKNYQFKIDMDREENTDGYHFYLKYIPTNEEIIHTSKKISSKIILLK